MRCVVSNVLKFVVVLVSVVVVDYMKMLKLVICFVLKWFSSNFIGSRNSV